MSPGGKFSGIHLLIGICFRAPWLWHNASPAIPIFFAYFVFICISSLIHASVTNPGVSLFSMTQTTFTDTIRFYRVIYIP